MKREDRKGYRPVVRRDLLMLAAAFCRLSASGRAKILYDPPGGFSASASETVALPRRAGWAWLGSAFHPLR